MGQLIIFLVAFIDQNWWYRTNILVVTEQCLHSIKVFSASCAVLPSRRCTRRWMGCSQDNWPSACNVVFSNEPGGGGGWGGNIWSSDIFLSKVTITRFEPHITRRGWKSAWCGEGTNEGRIFRSLCLQLLLYLAKCLYLSPQVFSLFQSSSLFCWHAWVTKWCFAAGSVNQQTMGWDDVL